MQVVCYASLSCNWVFYFIYAAGVGLPYYSVFSTLVLLSWLLQIILEWFCFGCPPLPCGGCFWVLVLILIAAELVWFAGVVALLLTALALMVWFVCSLVYGAVSSCKCRFDSDGLSR